VRARLVARGETSRGDLVVDLVGSPAVEGLVWTIRVVPSEEKFQLSLQF
jgi:hypothetical protein